MDRTSFAWSLLVLAWLAANKDALAGLGSFATIAGTIVAVIIFYNGLRQYKKAEEWKKTEFIAKLYSEFNDNESVAHAIWMIDGDDRSIYFFEGDKRKQFKVNIEKIYRALRSYKDGDRFSPLDLHIRDSFDCFFSYFEQLDSAIENGLIKKEEVHQYFFYWIDKLNKRPNDKYEEKLRSRILEYIETIGYRNTQRFLSRWR